jgi:uncharacterized membrane protein
MIQQAACAVEIRDPSKKADPMKQFVVSYLATGIIFLILDAIWLSLMGPTFYRAMLGDKMLETFSLAPAVVFYLIYLAGVLVFAVYPALASGNWATAAVYGAFFGFCAYATYDLTNQATLKDWPVLLTVADLAWGTFVSGVSATLGYLISSYVLQKLAA